MVTAEEELRRRRERGKLAQSAFRKRQAQAQQDMKDENARLKKAIADILAESRHEDRPELRAKIHSAAVLAGHGSDISIDTGAVATTIKPSPLRPYSDDSYVGVASVMFPFLGPGAFTFAGRIFWRLVEKNEALLRAQEMIRQEYHQPRLRMIGASGGTPTPVKQKLFTDLVLTVPPIQKAGPEGWLSMIKECLEYYRLKGWRLVAELPEDTARVVSELPLAETEDGDEGSWLTPSTAAQRVRGVVGDHVFAALLAPATKSSEKERARSLLRGGTEPIDSLLDMLADSFSCFGNGPRWEVTGFDRTLRSWMAGVMGGQIRDVSSGVNVEVI